jgi:hypothetical protein
VEDHQTRNGKFAELTEEVEPVQLDAERNELCLFRIWLSDAPCLIFRLRRMHAGRGVISVRGRRSTDGWSRCARRCRSFAKRRRARLAPRGSMSPGSELLCGDSVTGSIYGWSLSSYVNELGHLIIVPQGTFGSELKRLRLRA